MTKEDEIDPTYENMRSRLEEGAKIAIQKGQELARKIKKEMEETPIYEFEGVSMLENALETNGVEIECQRNIYEVFIRLYPYDPNEIMMGQKKMNYEDPMDMKIELGVVLREYGLSQEIEKHIRIAIPNQIDSELISKKNTVDGLDRVCGNKGMDLVQIVRLIEGSFEPEEAQKTRIWLQIRNPRYHLNKALQSKLKSLRKE